jgi:hypothetical protein
MAYTIAQTAGKRATSAWLILMPTDSDHAVPGDERAAAGDRVPSVQIVSTLEDDPRLLIGAAAIAGYAAQEAGLAAQIQEHLATATKEACVEVFALAQPDPKSPPMVTVTASRFPDRVQITVELSIAAANAAKQDGRRLNEGLVDHIQREMHEGRPAIVLVKYYRPVKHKA